MRTSTPLAWQELAGLAPEELAQRDIASNNLACAAGLPGEPTAAEVAECLDRLDHCATRVTEYTSKRLPEFHGHPAHYEHSEGIFRVVQMVRVVQQTFGVRYNEAKIPLDAPLHTRDCFIHGALLGPGGTCASLPVIYAAVGRRLGYPIKLVSCNSGKVGHLFNRWDDPSGERFNIEINNTGVNSWPDDYYRTGPRPMPPEVEKAGLHLQSMSPRQELADFLMHRGLRLLAHGRRRQSALAFAWALQMEPRNRSYERILSLAIDGWSKVLRDAAPPGFPDVHCRRWRERDCPAIPHEAERKLILLSVKEDLLNDPKFDRDLWEPMRQRGGHFPGMPWQVLIDFHGDQYEVRFRRELRKYDPDTGRWISTPYRAGPG